MCVPTIPRLITSLAADAGVAVLSQVCEVRREERACHLPSPAGPLLAVGCVKCESAWRSDIRGNMSVPVPAGGGGGEGRPDNVGILAADVYFPSTFVSQVSKHAHHQQHKKSMRTRPVRSRWWGVSPLPCT